MSQSGPMLYEYSPLSKGETRVVELLPAKVSTDDIEVRLVTVAEDDIPGTYQLLTYTYDSLQEDELVYCEGKQLQVQYTVFQALQALRKPQETLTGYIDSMCTNQEDVDETSNQISRMNQTNREASQTIFWLGSSNSTTTLAYTLLDRLNSARLRVFGPSRSQSNLLNPTEDQALEYRQSVPSCDSAEYRALDELLHRQIFTRAWTLPDIIVSRKAVVKCGPHEVSWSDFAYGLEGYASIGYPNMLKSRYLQMILSADKIHTACLDNPPAYVGFDNLLTITRTLHEPNWKDIVYSAFSILSFFYPESCALLEINIVNSANSLWTTADTLNKNPALAPAFSSLSMVEDPLTEADRDLSIPSWVPRWGHLGSIYRLNTFESSFKASAARGVEGLMTDGQRMQFEGARVDRISQIAPYLPPRRLCDKYNIQGANSFFFFKWYQWAKEVGRRKYQQDTESWDDRLQLHWIETVQAKGSPLWQTREPINEAQLRKNANAWLSYIEDEDVEESEDIRQFHAACLPAHGRRLGITVRGKFCLVSRRAAVHDLVCIPYGSKVPFVFRKSGDRYLNIGDCYVHGAMHGEALEWPEIDVVMFELY